MNEVEMSVTVYWIIHSDTHSGDLKGDDDLELGTDLHCKVNEALDTWLGLRTSLLFSWWKLAGW